MALTTSQKTQAALNIPCPKHKVLAGEPCPTTVGSFFPEACEARRDAAEAVTLATAARVEVIRDVRKSERHNYLGRKAKAGEIFYVCREPTYSSVDYLNGIALTEAAGGGYPFFEFPRDAVRALTDDTPKDPS